MEQATFEETKAERKREKSHRLPNPRLKGGILSLAKLLRRNVIKEELTEEHRMIGDTVTDFAFREIQEPLFKRGEELGVTNKADREEVWLF